MESTKITAHHYIITTCLFSHRNKWLNLFIQTLYFQRCHLVYVSFCLTKIKGYWNLVETFRMKSTRSELPSHQKCITEYFILHNYKSCRDQQNTTFHNIQQDNQVLPVPSLVLTSPAINLSSVDLPAPLGPTNATLVSKSIPKSRFLQIKG